MNAPIDVVRHCSNAAITEGCVPTIGMGRSKTIVGKSALGKGVLNGGHFHDLARLVTAGLAIIVVVESGTPSFIVAFVQSGLVIGLRNVFLSNEVSLRNTIRN